MTNSTSTIRQGNKLKENTVFVPPVCAIKVSTSANKSISTSRSQQQPPSSTRSLVRGSSPVGFGAAEDLETFLHETRRTSNKTRKGSGSGSGTSKSSSKAGRKPDCYVMSNHQVIMHRGF